MKMVSNLALTQQFSEFPAEFLVFFFSNSEKYNVFHFAFFQISSIYDLLLQIHKHDFLRCRCKS